MSSGGRGRRGRRRSGGGRSDGSGGSSSSSSSGGVTSGGGEGGAAEAAEAAAAAAAAAAAVVAGSSSSRKGYRERGRKGWCELRVETSLWDGQASRGEEKNDPSTHLVPARSPLARMTRRHDEPSDHATQGSKGLCQV